MTHFRSASEPDLCTCVKQWWIKPLYWQQQLETHQEIFGGGVEQIMLLIIQNACEGVWGQRNAIEDDVSPDLWHIWLTHMNEKGLQLLAKQSLIPMARGKSSNSCDYCLFGKHHRVSF